MTLPHDKFRSPAKGRNKHGSALFIVCTMLSGCATYQARPIAPESVFQSFEARTLDNPRLRASLQPAATAPPSWDLSSLTGVAFYFHPDLDVARAKWRVAESAIITAGARPNPSLGLSEEFNADAPKGTPAWSPATNLRIPIETAGKRGHRIAQARHMAEAAQLNLIDVAWQVRSRVRSSLLNLYPTEPLLAQQQVLEAERVRMMERRVQVGFAATPDLTQARIAMQQAALARDEARKRLAENRVQLANALGLPVQALDGVALSFDAFESVPQISALPLREVRREALLHRPDVRAALAEYSASQSALQLEVARQYPDFTLDPGLFWDAGQAKWSLGLSLILPLLNHNQGPIAEAEGKRQLAASHFLAVQTRAIGEVDKALAGYAAVLEELRGADAMLVAQRHQEQSAAHLQRAGETDRLGLLGAQVELAAAELAHIETLLQAQQALGLLEDAVRHPLNNDAPPSIAIEHNPRDKDIQ
jgi:cobalt-zinc-cadmium efflux system outer membrane protein